MGDATQTGLDSGKENGFAVGVLLDQVGVCDGGTVGTAVVLTSRGEVIVLAELAGGGVVGDHGVDATCRDGPEQVGLTQPGYVLGTVDVRLGDDTDPESVVYQPVTYDSRTVVRVVGVGVT